jgi:hypothetical protein
MPVVLMSRMEDNVQGQLFPGLAEILPKEFQERVKRTRGRRCFR